MADWLLIRLPHASGGLATWLMADSSGRVLATQQEGSLAQAAPFASTRRVCVVVPAADVVHTEADVPVKSGMRVQQIVPFALEEQLAEDVENLHFAVGQRPSPSARTPVAVVSKASIDGWLAELRGAGITPDALYSESDLVPANPGQAVGLLDEDCVIMRRLGRPPVTMPIDALPEAFALVLPAEDEMTAAAGTGQGLLLYTGAAEWHQHSRTVEQLRDRFDGIKVQLLTGGPLGLLAQCLPAAQAHGINLLQGPYAPKTTLATDWRAWRIAAILLAALLVLHAGGSAVELFALHHAERRVDAQVVRTFRIAMPGEHNAIDARRRMQQRLDSLGKGGGSGLLAALGALASAHANASDTVLRSLDFRNGTLELRVSAASPEVIGRLTRGLQAAGWQAHLTAGSVVGSHYEGRVEVKPGA
jgi:general secretion pathway protein L